MNNLNWRGLLTALVLLWLIAMLFTVTIAKAGDATLTWAPPTQRVDGSPLPIEELAGYTILVGAAPRAYTQAKTIEGGAVTSDTITGLGPGTVYFAIVARTTDGLQSNPSAEVSKTFEGSPAPPPEPPAGLTVQEVARAVYSFQNTANRIALVPVGTVPAGTPCDGAQVVRDSNGVLGYVVPNEAVAWAGSVRSEVVVAECQ